MNLKPPKNEIIWVQYAIKGETTYITTSTALRDYYYLYKVEDNKLVKTRHKTKNPTDLEDFIYK